MKPAVDADRRRQLSAIHAAATQLGMDTADRSPASAYRALLLQLTGKASAADLDARERDAVVQHLRRLQNKLPQQPKPKDGWQANKLRQLWAQLGAAGVLEDGTEAGLLRFVKAQTGRDALRWLSVAESQRVIEALKGWLARVQKKA